MINTEYAHLDSCGPGKRIRGRKRGPAEGLA